MNMNMRMLIIIMLVTTIINRKELEAMSVGLSTLPQMQIAFFQGVNSFSQQFNQLLDGYGTTQVEEVVGGARIRHVFQSKRDKGEEGEGIICRGFP